MRILMVSAEVAPFAKTGGLADAVSALSIALHKLGHDVRIVMPRYYKINRENLSQLPGPMCVHCGYREEWTAVYTTQMPDEPGLPIYFIDHEGCYGRDGIYGVPTDTDFKDNPTRFSLLCNGAFQLCRKTGWYPDIIHAHDWSAALAPVLLRFNERHDNFANTKSVFTIHNLGYQGVYSKHNYSILSLDWNHFYSSGLEDYDQINFLKSGLISADALTTVSPTYASEIQTQANGFKMDGILRARSNDLYGILNGVDTNVWNPSKDNLIPKKYTVKTIKNKLENKKALQERMGLEVNPDIPLIGVITRLADQKGVSEMFAPSYGCAYKMCIDMRLQFVVLGSGEKWCEDELRVLSNNLPNFASYIGYDENLSHLIEAGSDFFLMPSKYEPCGLNQMYSLLYGTLPIVRRTGGLADTVQNYNQETGEGTGFILDNLTPSSIYDTVGWAMYAWYNKPEHIAAMRERGMKQKFGWDVSAKKYIEIYEKLLK